MQATVFFKNLWDDYVKLAPQAEAIQHLFSTTYACPIQNDHVAFRTFARSPISIEKLQPLLAMVGYQPYDEYHFAEKKLFAKSYAHTDPEQPLVFLSELNWWDLHDDCQDIIGRILQKIPDDTAQHPDIFWSGTHWPKISWQDYLLLESSSEYAAWLSAHGLHANHFTVSINALPKLANITEIVKLLHDNNFALNVAGGEIKGTKADLLMQASTLAPEIVVDFADASHPIPGCYYEFAERLPDNQGNLFRGFVPASANKIFESTDRNQKR